MGARMLGLKRTDSVCRQRLEFVDDARRFHWWVGIRDHQTHAAKPPRDE
jgi:hypothetical protein